MRRSRHPALGASSFLLIALLGACASRALGTERPAESRASQVGNYRFEVRSSGQVIIEGWFLVTDDSVIVRAQPGPCRYDADSSRSQVITYQCNDRTVRFDRRRPVTGASVAWTARRMVTRTICVSEVVTATGSLVCNRQTRQRVEEAVMMRSRIEPIRDQRAGVR